MGVIAMAIISSLALSLFYFLKGGPQGAQQIARSLMMRIILSLILFTLLIIAYFMGWLHPHGLEF